ncbi:hypothetical protein ALC57_11645 [Trachymyrmex cornetzi]|uniref:Uncharacterized protein n=1 Tax=Trachymyrmex cornetzi TaxID=471704 RepID=A0A195DT69_9HYME|nr:hypothetical protein ALC57_11645 [Trachymyrmex cornetzi]
MATTRKDRARIDAHAARGRVRGWLSFSLSPSDSEREDEAARVVRGRRTLKEEAAMKERRGERERTRTAEDAKSSLDVGGDDGSLTRTLSLPSASSGQINSGIKIWLANILDPRLCVCGGAHVHAGNRCHDDDSSRLRRVSAFGRTNWTKTRRFFVTLDVLRGIDTVGSTSTSAAGGGGGVAGTKKRERKKGTGGGREAKRRRRGCARKGAEARGESAKKTRGSRERAPPQRRIFSLSLLSSFSASGLTFSVLLLPLVPFALFRSPFVTAVSAEIHREKRPHVLSPDNRRTPSAAALINCFKISRLTFPKTPPYSYGGTARYIHFRTYEFPDCCEVVLQTPNPPHPLSSSSSAFSYPPVLAILPVYTTVYGVRKGAITPRAASSKRAK